MAQKGKSIIDKALLEAEEIDKAFEANAKEILSRSMGSEIEEMVKESLEGSMALNEDDDDVELEMSDEIDIDADDDGEVELDLELGDDLGDDDDGEDLDLDLDMEDGEDVETIDLTGADDMDVITVFKKMGPEDEIEVVQDGDSIDIKDNGTGAEYRVELNGAGADMDMDDMDMDMEDADLDMDMDDMELDIDGVDMDMDGDEDLDLDMDLDIDMDGEGEDDEMDYEDDDMMEEEVVYEIEISEEDDEDDDMMDEDMDYEDEDEMAEASRTLGNGRKWGRKGLDKPSAAPRHLKQESRTNNSKLIKENKVLKHNFNKVSSENKELKGEYNKLVEALKQFRTKLNEVAVFNSNLTYAVRLFTENSTTKEEKVDIIKSFDEAKSLKESKMIYKQLMKEVSKKAPIKESIDTKVNETKGSGSKTQISESEVYVHPELAKMKKLWDFNYKY
jgi:hypothetical protein